MFHTLEEVSALFTPAELAAIDAAAEIDQFGGRNGALTSTVAWANHVEKLAAADDQYRGFTVEDSGVRINAINMIPKPDRVWWWYRVPADGPAAVSNDQNLWMVLGRVTCGGAPSRGGSEVR